MIRHFMPLIGFAQALLACATPAPLPRSYVEASSWRRYEEHLPPRLRIREGLEPQESWWAWQGHEIHLDTWEPQGAAHTTVILVHGGGGHGRILSPFALPLVEAGHRVLAPDLPGYGLTRVPVDSPPRLSSWVRLVAALAEREAQQGRPVVLFGLSLGGTTALYAATETQAVAGVVATTLLDVRDVDTLRAIATTPAAVSLLRGTGGLLDNVTLPVRDLAPLERMSTSPALSRLFGEDPLIGQRRVPLGFFRSLPEYQPPVALESFQRCPVLLAHPAADAWTPVALSRPLFDRLPAPKHLVLLEAAGHYPVEPPGHAQLMQAVRSFLEQVRSGG